MLSLKKLQEQVWKEDAVAEVEAERRHAIAVRAITMRYEASPAGIATALILSNLSRNVEGFPDTIVLSTGLAHPNPMRARDESRGSEWSLKDGVWRVVDLGDFDIWFEIKATSSTKFSLTDMVDEVLDRVEMKGSATAETAFAPFMRLLSGSQHHAELSALLSGLTNHAQATLNIRTTAHSVSENLAAENMEILHETVNKRFVDQEWSSDEVRKLVDELKAIGIAPEVALGIPVGILGLLTAAPPSPPLVAAQKKVSARKASVTNSGAAKPRAAK